MKSYLLSATILLTGCAGAVGTIPQDNGPVRSNCQLQDGGAGNNLWEQDTDAWLQTNPQVHLVFWGSYWLTPAGADEQSFYDQAWNTLANDPAFYKPMEQYGIGPGTFAGVYLTNQIALQAGLSDTDIQQELNNEIAAGELPLPSPDGNSQYAILFPPGTPSTYCTGNCVAYHSNAVYHDAHYTYQVIPYETGKPVTTATLWATSHEIYESATDPDGRGYWTGQGETEVGDYCDQQLYQLDGYTIQQVWSQNTCTCIPN